MPETDNADFFREVLETQQNGVLIVSRDGKIIFWNEGAERITRYRRHEVVGHACQHNILTHCDQHYCDLCGTECPFAGVVHEGKTRSALVHFQHKDGHSIAVQAWSVPIRNSHGSVIAVAQSFMEAHHATVAGNSSSTLPLQGCLDETSRLPNREYAHLYLHEHLTTFAHQHLPFGVLRIRVDELAQMGSSYGREAEHALIRLLVQTVRENLDSASFLARWTPDEFLTIVTDCQPSELIDAGRHLEESLKQLTLHWWGDHLSVRASVGQTMVQPGDTIESLLQRAGFAHHPSTSTKRVSAGSSTP